MASRTLSSDAHDDHHGPHPTFEPGPFSHTSVGLTAFFVCGVSVMAVLGTVDHQLVKHGYKK